MSGPPVYSKEQVLLHAGSQKQKRVRFRTRKIRYLQKINKKSEYPEGYSDGRSGGIRTHGLLDPNQARYQTSPHPVISLFIIKGYQTPVKADLGS